MIMNEPVSGWSWSCGMVGEDPVYQRGEGAPGPQYQGCEQVAHTTRLLLIDWSWCAFCTLPESGSQTVPQEPWGLEGLSFPTGILGYRPQGCLFPSL